MLLSNYIVIKISSTSYHYNYPVHLSKIKRYVETTLSDVCEILLVELQRTLLGQSQTFSWSFQSVPGPQEVW